MQLARWQPSLRIVVSMCCLGFSACEDKAEPDYKICVEKKEAKQFPWAQMHCRAAVRRDPDSRSGEAAAKLLPELEAKAKEAVEQRKQWEQQAAKRHVKETAESAARLRGKIERRYSGRTRDGECIDKGLPPYRWHYEGGQRWEIDTVAEADGCRHLLPGRQDFLLFQVFCCPQEP